MGLKIRASVTVEEGAFQQAALLRKEGRLRLLEQRALPDGKTQLRGKATDHFNFVDHPMLVTDSTGTVILEYSCDCPRYRAERGFCVHCAGLALELEGAAALSTNSAVIDFVPPVQTEEEPEQEDLPDLEEFSYRFCNSANDLYPGVMAPRIPLVRYKQMFGDNQRARMLYRIAGLWGGSCFGMVATSTMLRQQDCDVEASDFNPSAQVPSELGLSDRNGQLKMTLHQFIEAVHILQFGSPINGWRNRYLNDKRCLDKLAERVRAFQRGEGSPVGMAVWKSPKMDDGHSVLPYRLEKLSQTEEKLYIYDPNWPLTVRYAYLKKDEEGHYTNWRFPMNDHTTYSTDVDSKLSFDDYDVYKKEWDDHSGAAADSLLRVASGTAVLDENGALVARASSGGVESYRDDVCQVLITDGMADPEMVLLSMPVGCYTVCNEDPSKKELVAELTGMERAVTVTTTARQVTVKVNDEEMIASARITEPDCDYTVVIATVADEIDQEVKLQGVTGQEGLCFAQQEQQLFGKGVEGAVLYVGEQQVSLSYIKSWNEEDADQQEPELIVNAPAEQKPEDPEN